MDLLKTRVVSFAYEFATLIVTATLGIFASPEFANLVGEHFGTGMVGSIIMLAVMGAVKHIRNKKLVAKLGGEGERPLII